MDLNLLYYKADSIRQELIDTLSLMQYTKASRLARKEGKHITHPDIISQITKNKKLIELANTYLEKSAEWNHLTDVEQKRKTFKLIVGG